MKMLIHGKHILKGKRKLANKLSSSQLMVVIKIKKKDFQAFLPAILLDMDGMLLEINCQQHPRHLDASSNGTNCQVPILLAILLE